MNENPSEQVRNELLNLSRKTNQDTQTTQILYALEGFLNRLSRSDASNILVLKGGLLLAAHNQRRPTSDADFAARWFDNDQSKVKEGVASILAVKIDDGLEFQLDSLRAEVIREHEAYFGQRISLEAHLGKSRVTIKVDVNFGDDLYPGPETKEFPRLLPNRGEAFELLVYPVELVIAEKFLTMVSRLATNTRLKDVADIWGLLPNASPEVLSATILRRAELQHIGDLDVRKQLIVWAQSREQQWRFSESKNYPHLKGRSFLEVFTEVANAIFPLVQTNGK